MRRVRRLLLIGSFLALAVGASAYGYLMHATSPEAPRLSASVERDSLRVGELMRSYAFYSPAALAPGAPLLIAIHGSMGDAEQMRRATAFGFERLADQHGFVVVYPEGYERHWNDCRRKGPYAAKRLGIDDVGFMRALVDHLRSTRGVDSARVFAVGYSNGGHLGYRLALEAPELVRAVAVVGANLPTSENLDCVPTEGATPVLILNGTEDPINPYEGGKVTLFGFGDRGSVLSARASAEYFAGRIGISGPPGAEPIAQPDHAGPSTAERALWRSPTGTEVVLYTIHGGGHTIPQPHARFPRILGRTHAALDGPSEIWSFFARQGAQEAH